MCLQVPPLLGIYLGAYFRGKYIDITLTLPLQKDKWMWTDLTLANVNQSKSVC